MTGLATAGTAWMVGAACAQRLDLPWTLDAEQVRTWDRGTMTVLCGRCHVRQACDLYADQVGADAGFWAGSHRDTDTNGQTSAALAWVAHPLPGLDGAA
jgi:hypothetical protein